MMDPSAIRSRSIPYTFNMRPILAVAGLVPVARGGVTDEAFQFNAFEVARHDFSGAVFGQFRRVAHFPAISNTVTSGFSARRRATTDPEDPEPQTIKS
jgi:hypothetical protein